MKKSKGVSPVVATVVILVAVLLVALVWMHFSSSGGTGTGRGMSFGRMDASSLTPENLKQAQTELQKLRGQQKP